LTGCFENEALLSMDNLVRFPLVTRVVHIECTGNKRAEISFMANLKGLSRYANFLSFDYLLKLLDPKEWKFWINFVKRTGIRGGLLFSNGVFTGVKLFDILNEYPLRKDAKELVFEGVDKGGETIVQRTRKEDTHYARSWDIEELKKHEPILCFEMNGKPLAIEHGAPLRLVIPGIYGAEQVKWLGRIISTSEKYRGYYQESDYGYRIDGEMVPVHEMRPKAMVIKVLKKNKNILVFGVGWRGQSPIERIEVSVDGMNSWNQALLLCKGVDHSWIFWRFELPKDLKGTVTISPRAFCVNGESQPLKPGKYSFSIAIPFYYRSSVANVFKDP